MLLLLRTATGDHALAWTVSSVVMAWFAVCWLLLPFSVLRRAERRQADGAAGEAR